MAITAAEVNNLRNLTGAGMMDCKKALTEAEGDVEKAIEILRKKGQKVSASRQDREAKEGAVFAVVSADGKSGVILELNCETDFVARNDDFQGLGTKIAEAALAAKATDIDAVGNLNLDGRSVNEHLTDAMGRIGEKISVGKYQLVIGEKLVSYIHAGAKVGVLVAFNQADGYDAETIGKDVAMQIAAMNPLAVDKDGVDRSIVEKEIEIGKEQARQEGKPEAILEKIAVGKLQKFFKDNTLLEQEFIKDPSVNIAGYLKQAKAGLTVTQFVRLHLG